jgi:hypothetical protein
MIFRPDKPKMNGVLRTNMGADTASEAGGGHLGYI